MKTIKGKYIKKDDMKEYFATGAFGGPNPHGMFVVNFYNENYNLPDEYSLDVDDQGKVLSEATSVNNEKPLERAFVCRLIMSNESAKSLAEWILSNLSEGDKND